MNSIYIALVSLSIGWGMHASVTQKLCFRCMSRDFGLRLTKYAMENEKLPKFIVKLILSFGLGCSILSLFQDVTRVFGWKTTLKIVSEFIKSKGGSDGGKKA